MFSLDLGRQQLQHQQQLLQHTRKRGAATERSHGTRGSVTFPPIKSPRSEDPCRERRQEHFSSEDTGGSQTSRGPRRGPRRARSFEGFPVVEHSPDVAPGEVLSGRRKGEPLRRNQSVVFSFEKKPPVNDSPQASQGMRKRNKSFILQQDFSASTITALEQAAYAPSEVNASHAIVIAC